MTPPAHRPVRLLVVNGCSMTYGDELRDRTEHSWAALLARLLDVPLVNLGACAGSNHRLVRVTVEQLGRLAQEYGLEPDEVLFLGMWTSINRFEVFTDEPDPRAGLPDLPDGGWRRIHASYIARRDRLSRAWYRDLQSEGGDRSEFLLHWTLLDAWLARRGYRYGFLWAYDPDPATFTQFPQYDSSTFLTRTIGSDALPYGGPSLYSLGKAGGDLGPDGHPLERTQQLYVEEHLHRWVTELLARGPA
uniref:SGNH/GDSL hydrolase family protein n=1 Tax=Streptomyces sp. NBC_00008 TaxID=2903610 RepID=A0AAU2W0V8_9ACTN